MIYDVFGISDAARTPAPKMLTHTTPAMYFPGREYFPSSAELFHTIGGSITAPCQPAMTVKRSLRADK